jgi:hypothetical protein
MHTTTCLSITIKATQTVAWPHFAGSTLRGAFGRALRKAACITGQDKCTGCPLRNSCTYGVVFDPAAPAQPLHPSFRDGLPRYLVRPPALGACQLPAGQIQNFDLILLPGTQSHHQLIKHSLSSAVEKELFQPGLFQLVDIETSQTPLQQQTPSQLPDSNSALHANTQPGTGYLTLRWLTPMRLQQHGKPLFNPKQLDAPGLVRALLRRQLQWQQITNESAIAPDSSPQTQDPLRCAQACTLDTRLLHWHDIHRKSGSQNQKLPLGGLIGSATLSGPRTAIQTLLPLLQLGEHLHIGKEIVMGMGRFRIGA